jgi:glycosyltransferase involved in cell wall biosynthesis
MRLAIVGTRGIPNNYGGFETLAEYLVKYLADQIDITVYCSSKDMDGDLAEYNGAKLKYIPVTSHGAFGILYDTMSLLSAVNKYDKVLLLGFGGGFLMPFLRNKSKKKITVNIGGLDWKRNKWSPSARKVIKKAEELLIRNCGKVISDNIGIRDYLIAEYNRESTLIAYGGDQAMKKEITDEFRQQYSFLNGNYAFIVTRIQEDNNINLMLDAFLAQDQLPFVIVGNWNNSEYGIETKKAYLNKSNLILLDAIYNRDILDVLRSNCTLYVHGHSAGGTNPSLAEAMYLGLPVIAFASGYNEYTTANKALYFSNAAELTGIIKNYKSIDRQKIGSELKQIAEKDYRWEHIAAQYKDVIMLN